MKAGTIVKPQFFATLGSTIEPLNSVFGLGLFAKSGLKVRSLGDQGNSFRIMLGENGNM